MCNFYYLGLNDVQIAHCAPLIRTLGVLFIHKFITGMARVWQKKEGLMLTGKGSKDLPGGRRVHVMVTIAHGKGVILVEPYQKINGIFFANFIKNKFNIGFAKASTKHGGKRIFIMDNDPSQQSGNECAT